MRANVFGICNRSPLTPFLDPHDFRHVGSQVSRDHPMYTTKLPLKTGFFCWYMFCFLLTIKKSRGASRATAESSSKESLRKENVKRVEMCSARVAKDCYNSSTTNRSYRSHSVADADSTSGFCETSWAADPGFNGVAIHAFLLNYPKRILYR